MTNILSDHQNHVIKVVLPGYHRVFELTPKQFEKTFGVHYLPHLHFENDQKRKYMIRQCPWVLSLFGKDNREIAKQFQEHLKEGFVQDVTVKWIDDQIGYGLFTNVDLAQGSYIGEYTGEIRLLGQAKNPYCFHYPTKWWSYKYYVIDALHAGNELRFINHSADPNLEPVCALEDGILHTIFLAKRDIQKDEQLFFYYSH